MHWPPPVAWAATVREVQMAIDGWAMQYPEPDAPPTREEWEEHKASLTPAQKEWLGIRH